MRNRVPHLILCALLAGCGSNGSDGSGGGGGFEGDASYTLPDGRVVRGNSGVDTQIVVSGLVFAEGAPARGEGGVFDPPPGAPVSSQGHVQGASVFVLDLSGDVIAESVTDSQGRYSIDAPSRDPMFLYVEAIEGYAGSIRYEQQRAEADYDAYDVVLQSVDGLAQVVAMSGSSYDGNRGLVAVGVNAADDYRGGEGADVSASHDPAFNLLPGDVYMGNRLAPVCSGSSAPDCVPERTKQIFFPNVQTGRVQISALNPPTGGSCALRFDVPQWRVEPHTLTIVNVDCM